MAAENVRTPKNVCHTPHVYDPEDDVGVCQECGRAVEACVCESQLDEEDVEEEDPEPEITRRGKRVRQFEQSMKCDEHYDAFYEEPDLRSYFSQFSMTEASQIALCRTWANYLAQKTRVKSSKKN